MASKFVRRCKSEEVCTDCDVVDAVMEPSRFDPKYPTFQCCSARLHSYQTWPKFLPTTPPALAKAGFVYTGCGDSVFCFYCNTKLKDWKPTDCPEEEHRKWSPNCPYIKMCFIGREEKANQRLNPFRGLDVVDG